MKYYAVIDTNVIVSAMLKWDSVPGSIMNLVLDGPITPLVNDKILEEYRDVLLRPKFHFPPRSIEVFLDELKQNSQYVNAQKIDEYLPDAKDAVFYEVVMEKRKEENAYLVTGNLKHFPVKPFIVTPREMLDIIIRDLSE